MCGGGWGVKLVYRGKGGGETEKKEGGCKSPMGDLGLVSWVVQRDRRGGKTPQRMLFIQAMMSSAEQETVAACYYHSRCTQWFASIKRKHLL